MAEDNGEAPKVPLQDLTKKQIISAEDIQLIPIEVPEWQGTVYLKSISGKERDYFENIIFDTNSSTTVRLKNFRARFLVKSICYKDGTLIFTDEEAETLGAKNGAVIDRLYEKAQEISGMRKKDINQMGNASGSDKT